MMFWYDHDVSGWGWFAMSAGMILFWALIITVAVLLFRTLNQPQENTHVPATPSPRTSSVSGWPEGRSTRTSTNAA